MQSKVLIPAITGTSAMTVFSYLVSNTKEENYREPLVLAIMIKRLMKDKDAKAASMIAWCLHYLVGILFTSLYAPLWRSKKIQPSLLSGLGYGSLCGLVGIAGWKIAFTLHPDPPRRNLKNYFGH